MVESKLLTLGHVHCVCSLKVSICGMRANGMWNVECGTTVPEIEYTSKTNLARESFLRC